MQTTTEDTPAKLPHQRSSLAIYLRLLRYVKPYRWLFFFAVIGFVLYSASQPAMAKFMEYLVRAIENKNSQDRYILPLVIVGIVFVRSVGAFMGNYLISTISYKLIHTLRIELFNRIVHLPGKYFDSHASGHLISVITYNVNGVTAAATDALKTTLREGGTVLFLLAYLLWEDWRLTLVLLMVAPLIGVSVNYVGKRLRRLSSKMQHTVGDITQVSSEMINGYRVMRSFGGEDYEKARFVAASQKNYVQNMKIVLTSCMNTPVMQMLIAVSMAIMVFVALGLMQIDDTGAFIGYMTAVGAILKPLRQLSDVIPTIQKGVAAADSIFLLLDEEPEKDHGQYQVTRARGAVTIQGLSFSYGPDASRPALADINLDVAPGEVIALVGRSGSGKTTLVNMLTRFYDSDQGQILLDGIPVQDYQLNNLRQQIALVNQQVVLFNDTVAANIAYGALATTDMEAIRRAADAAYATEFIEQLPQGFDTLIGEGGTRLSGGQRQRLAIARAILKDAPILILDEATSALDNESEGYIQAALDKVMQGRTTFVVAHRLSTIERADRILVMSEGRIIEQGTHSDLLARQGHYSRLHSRQFREEPEDSLDADSV